MASTLPVFGEDSDGMWIFSPERLAEMRADVHLHAQNAVLQHNRSSENDQDSNESIGPSPGKKAKTDVEMISLAEDLMLQARFSFLLCFRINCVTSFFAGLLFTTNAKESLSNA